MSIVQIVQGSIGTGTATVTLNNVTSGNTIALLIFTASSLASAPTDSNSNTYHSAGDFGGSYYAYGVSGGTVTVSASINPVLVGCSNVAADAVIYAFELLSPPNGGDPLDVHNYQASTGTAVSSPSVTTTLATDVLLGYSYTFGPASSPYTGAGSGFTNFQTLFIPPTSGLQNEDVAIATSLTTVIGSYSSSFTLSSSNNTQTGIVAYKSRLGTATTAVPSWSAAVPNQPGKAGTLNQPLTTHALNYIYAGSAWATASGATGTPVPSKTFAIDQPFTLPAGQTSVSYALLNVTTAGTAADALVSIQTDNGLGLPSGNQLCSVLVPAATWLGLAGASYPVFIPIGLTGLTAGATYHFVINSAGAGVNYINYATYTSTASHLPGGYTSANGGTTWTNITGNFQITLYTGNTGQLYGVIEDGGAKWTGFYPTSTSNASPILYVLEYTTPQDSVTNSAASTFCTLGYSGGVLTGVS